MGPQVVRSTAARFARIGCDNIASADIGDRGPCPRMTQMHNGTRQGFFRQIKRMPFRLAQFKFSAPEGASIRPPLSRVNVGIRAITDQLSSILPI